MVKSDTVKKVNRLYCSTYTHARLWIGKSTWPQGPRKLGEGMAACYTAFAIAPLETGKALD